MRTLKQLQLRSLNKLLGSLCLPVLYIFIEKLLPNLSINFTGYQLPYFRVQRYKKLLCSQFLSRFLPMVNNSQKINAFRTRAIDVIPLSTHQGSAPIMLSARHFYLGDTNLIQAVGGLRQIHETFLGVQTVQKMQHECAFKKIYFFADLYFKDQLVCVFRSLLISQ